MLTCCQLQVHLDDLIFEKRDSTDLVTETPFRGEKNPPYHTRHSELSCKKCPCQHFLPFGVRRTSGKRPFTVKQEVKFCFTRSGTEFSGGNLLFNFEIRLLTPEAGQH